MSQDQKTDEHQVLNEEELMSRASITVPEMEALIEHLALSRIDVADHLGLTYSTFQVYLSKEQLPAKHQDALIQFFLEAYNDTRKAPKKKSKPKTTKAMPTTDNTPGSSNGQPEPDPTEKPPAPQEKSKTKQPGQSGPGFKILEEEITEDDIPDSGRFSGSKYAPIAERAEELEDGKGFSVQLDNYNQRKAIQKQLDKIEGKHFVCAVRKVKGRHRLFIVRKDEAAA